MLQLENYKQYVTSTIKLVRSFVIKSNQTINSINKFILTQGEKLPNNEISWKYYKNLAGIPYSSAFEILNDEEFTILSLDTGEDVPFNSNTLLNHPLTIEDLKSKDNSYKNLITKYPYSKLFINGVITPVETNISIPAKDYTLLYYDDKYVNDNETLLISLVQKFIDNYVYSYDDPNFNYSDNLYGSANLALLYLNLVLAIINIRLEFAKTNQAHDFHVDNYLAGFFNLKNHIASLTKNQKLFLYRNIYSMVFLGGTKDNLDFLNTEFIKPASVSISQYHVYQDNRYKHKSLLDNPLSTELIKNVNISEFPYDSYYYNEKNKTLLPPIEVIVRINQQSLYNKNDNEEDLTTLIDATLHTNNHRVVSKLLSIYKSTNYVNYYIDVNFEKISHWIFLTANNFIKYDISVNTNDNYDTVLDLNPKQAFIVFLYCVSKAANLSTNVVPSLLVRKIMKENALTKNEQLSIIEKKYYTGKVRINNVNKGWNRYNQIKQNRTLPRYIKNEIEFDAYIQNVINNKILNELVISLERDTLGQSQLEFLVESFYSNVLCTFTDYSNYSNLFAEINYDFSTLTNEQLNVVSESILKHYTSIDMSGFNDKHTNDIVEIVKAISSYTILFIKSAQPKQINFIKFPLQVFDDVELGNRHVIEATAPYFYNQDINNCWTFSQWGEDFYSTCEPYHDDQYIFYNTPPYPYIGEDSYGCEMVDPVKFLFSIGSEEIYEINDNLFKFLFSIGSKETYDVNYNLSFLMSGAPRYDNLTTRYDVTPTVNFIYEQLVITSNYNDTYASVFTLDENYPYYELINSSHHHEIEAEQTLTVGLKRVVFDYEYTEPYQVNSYFDFNFNITPHHIENYTTSLSGLSMRFRLAILYTHPFENYTTTLGGLSMRFRFAVLYTHPFENYTPEIKNVNFNLRLPDAVDSFNPSVQEITFILG